VKIRHELAQNLATTAVADTLRAMDVTHSYWFAMLAASAFGTNVGDLWAEILFPGRSASLASLLCTVAGDLIHHNIGLYSASAALCLILAGLIVLRESRAPLSMLLFWSIVLAERCAGTVVGGALASRRAVGLGYRSHPCAPPHLRSSRYGCACNTRGGDNDVRMPRRRCSQCGMELVRILGSDQRGHSRFGCAVCWCLMRRRVRWALRASES